nr:carboxylesterase [Pharsalia antennata]
MLILSFLFLLYCDTICLSPNELPEVDTPLGRVRGVWRQSLDGRDYAVFEGIPYAKPPEEELRFEEPQPATPWSGIWIANSTFTCLQLGMFSPVIQGQEDCLYLNVYVPAQFLKSPKNLEVVVVIHGGGFMVGDAHTQTRSDFFMDKDIVLVTINYRVGLFGFLSTEDGVIPGNNGLKDQSLALRWVKDNIASFGGNPHSITIAGISAGGASAHFHYFSPLSKGLFNRGISQSGTALAPWVIKESPLENAKKLAISVDCPDNPTEDLKKCLKEKPALTLIQQTPRFYGYDKMPFTPFAPVVEKGSKKPFLDEQPFWLLKSGKVLDVPWITSHAADDGLLPSAVYWTKLEEINENWAKYSPYLLDCNYTLPESKRGKVSKKILDHYLGLGEKINRENFKEFTQIFTDRYFGVPGETAAKMQAKVSNSPVYYYFFNYREGENKGVEFFSSSPELEGVAHGEDSIYLQGFLTRKQFSKKDKQLKDAFHNMLYTFASTGKPSFDGTDNWQPTGHSELTYLNVTGPEDMKLQKVQNLTPSEFWRNLGLLENENLVPPKEEL